MGQDKRDKQKTTWSKKRKKKRKEKKERKQETVVEKKIHIGPVATKSASERRLALAMSTFIAHVDAWE